MIAIRQKMVRASAASVCFAALVALGMIAAGNAYGEDAVTLKRATLRADPSTRHKPIDILEAGDDVELVEPTPTAGYYHVRTEDGQEGWIYARNLQLVPAPGQPSAPGGTPSGTGTTGVASAIPADWEHPAPNSTTFDGPDGHCGPTGDGGDTITNARKNRTDVPARYHEVTWDALQSLPYPVAGKSLLDWTPAQRAQIEPYQGVAVSVVGYMTAIKVQDHGSGESTNCHFTNADEVDWHIPLVGKAGDPEARSVVVETTPRVRKLHPKWTPARLAPWVSSDAPVRISGWTMMDPEHRAHLNRYRSTLWEIHPITRIEVLKDGQWVDLDSLP